MKTDRQLQKDVLDELEFNPAVSAENIGISVKDGVVTLNGHVPSYAEKYAAEKATFRVAGVKAIANDISVKLPGSSQRSDADIAAAAINAIQWNISIPSSSIQVTVENGVVILRGEVDWVYQREAASSAVRYLAGVVEVRNHIALKNRVLPGDVKDRIEKALVRAAEADAQNIHVEAIDGRVVLKGKVRSHAELEDAKWAAWAAPGVRVVETQLAVA